MSLVSSVFVFLVIESYIKNKQIILLEIGHGCKPVFFMKFLQLIKGSFATVADTNKSFKKC